MGADVGVQNGRIVEQGLDPLQRVDGFDQARVMVVEGALHGAAVTLAELGQFGVRLGGAALVAGVQPGQGTDAVDAAGEAQRLIIRRLQVRGRQGSLADIVAYCLGATWSVTTWPSAGLRSGGPPS